MAGPRGRSEPHARPVTGSAPSWAGRRIGIGAALGRVSLILALAFGSLALGAGYWQVIESPNLSRSPDDAAVIAAARNVLRGEITDRDGELLARNERDQNREPYRVYASNALSGVLGYSSRQFGQAGLEAAWNAELSGISSADPLRDLVRKFQVDPSDPQDLKTTLVLELQQAAVSALGRNRGAVVMLNPRNGEVLVLASTPTYNASAIADPRDFQPTRSTGSWSTRALAAAPARHERPVRPGLGVQDRHLDRRAREWCRLAGDDVPRPAPERDAGLAHRRLPGARRPPPDDRGARAQLRRGHRGLVQHLVRRDRRSDRRRRPRRLRRPAGLRRGTAVRPRNGAVADQQRRRVARRRVLRPRRARERGLRAGGDARDAAADGTRRGDGRERRDDDAATPRARGDGEGRHDGDQPVGRGAGRGRRRRLRDQRCDAARRPGPGRPGPSRPARTWPG